MNLKRMLSGMQPSGRLHLGNWLGALKNWIRYQKEYDAYFFVADWHALSTNYAETGRIREYAREMLLDWLAAGVDPNQSTVFVQSRVPQHAVLHLLLSMITPVPWLERNPTFKEKQDELRDRDLTTYGFLGYPVLQSADILIYKADVVPVGADQLPHLELTREIARRFNHLYRPTLPEPQALLAEIPKVLGADNRKMSKSYGNALYLSDSPAATESYVKTMITDPQKIRKADPGRPEICNVFSFHKMFSDPDRIAEIDRDCRSGALGCVACKTEAGISVNRALAPLREKRKALESRPKDLDELVTVGSARAEKTASETLAEVTAAMKI